MPLFMRVHQKGLAASYAESLSLTETDQKLMNFFKKYDKNGDGQLNKAELKEAFRYLGALIPSWRVKRALRHADADGDGCISVKEMKDLVEYISKFGYNLN